MTAIIARFADISDLYDAAFVDLWGCMHDGIAAFPAAVAAMQGFRSRGGKVVFVTNAPRPRGPVEAGFASLGIPADAYDIVATSGDAARAAMFQGVVGRKVWFVGEAPDQAFFAPLKLVADPVTITQVPLTEAEGIVCCGPFDRFADPETMRPQFLFAREKSMKLLCANPDLVVDRGGVREWCAGALAALYAQMGGTALYFGKPHPPIYDLARRRLAALGVNAGDARIIAIGDGIGTDIQGAMGEDIDSLFITGGLARAETRTADQPDAAALAAYLAQHRMTPTFSAGFLR